jgi:hypothetical protein
MGDWGYDHIIVPFAHNLKEYKDYQEEGGKPEHVFSWAPGGATNSEDSVEAGALLTYKLLQRFEGSPKVEFFPSLDEANFKEKSFWHTYSEWLLCEKEDKESESHPLWRSHYKWKVEGNPNGIDSIKDFKEYDKLVVRDVFLESGDRSLFNSIEDTLIKLFSASNKTKKPLVFLRSVVGRKEEGKKNGKSKDGNCEADFRNPPIYQKIIRDEKLDKESRNELLKSTILLLEIGELKTYGAALQDALSWDSLLEETAQTVRQIAHFWRYFAIVVSFHGLGALLYLPGSIKQEGDKPAEGEYTLVYYPGDIENLTGFSSEDGMFGNTTILHTALSYAFDSKLAEVVKGKDTKNRSKHFHEIQTALEDALAAGLYASRELFNNGPFRAQTAYDPEFVLYKATKVYFPTKAVCSFIQKYPDRNKERIRRFKKEKLKTTDDKHQIEKEKSPSLPYIFRVKEGAFISDDEAAEHASYPLGMYSEPRKAPDNTNHIYPFESILKEALYQTHDYTRDLPQSFSVAPNSEDEKKWQHHRQKLTLENANSISFQLSEKSILYQLCKNIVQYGKSRYRNVELYQQKKNGSYPEKGEPINTAFKSNTPFAIPYLIINDYLAYDSTEIKQTCDINKLLRDYTNDSKRHKPTSICVFGQPGAGKSFLVEQLAKRMSESYGSELEPELLTFNVSQMKSTSELIDAWHRVRDAVLRDKLPFVFFDEFDCAYDKQKLGWLKYFISPMQDGTFIGERGHLHQIGKAVFIFAGGLYESMTDFRDGIQVGETKEKIKNYDKRKSDLRECKQPDFVSRIRGFINVAGPNKRRDGGMLHYLRRATLLRTTLVKKFNVGKDDFIDIDDRVLSAFINVETYHNNTRSMQSILELSSCPSNGKLGASDIYVDDTLDLYVSSDFAGYLRGDD